MLYPLKFKPILKEMIWGGKIIPQKLNIEVQEDAKVGEFFAVSGLPKDVSVIANGSFAGKTLIELIDEFKGEILGDSVYEEFDNKFPLLIKFIDANDDLSVQVHPNDEQARMQHNAFGKTEMWYVVDNQKGASLISGFTKKTNADEYQQMFNKGKLMELMQEVGTNKGDCFFIPAGRVHSIGRGNVIAEIQQTSDITYRIYDFDRKDKEGNPRELHKELALKAMNYDDDQSGKVDYQAEVNRSSELATCKYFTTNLLKVSGNYKADYNNIESFVILICTEGRCSISVNGELLELHEFEASLIPACINEVKIESPSGANLLEVYI